MKHWRYTATFEVTGTFTTADEYDKDDENVRDEAIELAHERFAFGHYTDAIEVEAVEAPNAA